ncbi:hypothetical protein EW145_g2646 [Phellinidium pouzarii]|uniref:Protein kinase domain-containing protein n=1 Tax=Phellinidium pouzarii TaxID=167371 RepID=A0A4S4LBL9_9AGAM|nr:hypothetical protein EW145_g2646 [Phellinidium pouzarii]
MTDVIGTISSCVDLVILIRKFVQDYREADSDLKDKLDNIQAKTAVLRLLKEQIEKYPSIRKIIIDNFAGLDAKLREAFEDVREWARKFRVPLTTKFQRFYLIDKGKDKEERLIAYGQNEAHARCAFTSIKNTSVFQRLIDLFIIGKHRVDYVYIGKLAIDRALSVLKEIETDMHSLSLRVIIATVSRGEELPEVDSKHLSQIHPSLPFISAARKRDKNLVSLASRTFDKRRIRTTDLEEFDICGGAGVQRLKAELIKDLVPELDSRATYILDMKRTPENSPKARAREEEAAKKFARLFLEDLSEDDDALCKTTGLLPCLGYVESRRIDGSNELISIEQILRLPKRISGFQTLRSILLDEWTEESIPETPDRLRLAVKLLESVLVLHAIGLVHKAISPDTILVTHSDDVKIGTPYLFGFHQTRGEFQESGRSPSDPNLRKSLYIHPNNTQDAR